MGDSTVQDEYVQMTQAEVDVAAEDLGEKIANLCDGQAVEVIARAFFSIVHRSAPMVDAWLQLIANEVRQPTQLCNCPKCLAERRAQRAQA